MGHKFWGFKFFGGAGMELSACAMGKWGHPLANAILSFTFHCHQSLVTFNCHCHKSLSTVYKPIIWHCNLSPIPSTIYFLMDAIYCYFETFFPLLTYFMCISVIQVKIPECHASICLHFSSLLRQHLFSCQYFFPQ